MVGDVIRKLTPLSAAVEFMELAQADLLAVDEGNFARFQVRPSEYFAWRDISRR